MLELLARFRLAKAIGDVVRSIGGWGNLKAWRAWNLYYLGIMAKAAEQCGWSPDEPSDDPVWQALTAAYLHYRGRIPQSPPERVPPGTEELLAIIRWASEHICERDLPEARAKYARMLQAPIYRAYRQALYRYFLVPLVRRGEVEAVLSIGGGLVEPWDLLEVADREGIHFELYVQEVDDAVARALAASGFRVYLGDVAKLAADVHSLAGKPYFDLATVQAVLHWTEDPIRLLTDTAKIARYVLVGQGYGPYNAAITVATTMMGARRYIADAREVDGWAEQAGLLPVKVIKGYGVYLGLFKSAWAARR